MLKLIGLLDSPFVRRVAIALQQLGLAFEHQPISVLRQVEQFRQINPLIKAPTLITADGLVLMESSLILDYAQSLAGKSLLPPALADKAWALRSIGLSLVVCEKAVQGYLERLLRPAEQQFEPWLERVQAQQLAGLQAIEQQLIERPLELTSEQLDLAAISLAVTWDFASKVNPLLQAADYPQLVALSQQAEQLAVFRKAAFGSGTYPTA